MKIYRIGMYENATTDSILKINNVKYAHFSAVGTWVSIKTPCKTCGWHWQDYGPPLLIEWAGSGNIVGDFSWDGPFGYLFVVNEKTATFFKDNFLNCTFHPAKLIKSNKKINIDSKNTLWVRCETIVGLDLKLSDVKLTSLCEKCGNTRYTFRNKGITIKRDQILDNKMFRLKTNGNSLATFITEDLRISLQKSGFSNIAFSEAGEIIP